MSETTPSRLESKLLDDRRIAGGLGGAPTRGGKALYRALAFSGGGIRSATFALGVLQAVARDGTPGTPDTSKPGELFRASRLSSFDYLSTVSGGGYLGAFLCSLFQPDRLRATGASGAAPGGAAAASAAPDVGKTLARIAADDAVQVLRSGPPGRIRSDASYAGEQRYRAPLAWLRENGRYLIPTGVGDAFYAAALGIRNWLALHYVIGTVLMALVALVGLARSFLARSFAPVRDWENEALASAIVAWRPDRMFGLGEIWWSPLFLLALASIVLVGLPLGIAFWLVHERDDGSSSPFSVAMLCTLLVGLGMLAVGHAVWPELATAAWTHPSGLFARVDESPRRFAVVAGVGLAAVAASACYVGFACIDRMAAMQRVLLTRRLATVLVGAVAIAGVAVVDTVGQTLYLLACRAEHAGPLLTPAGLAAALAWLAKRSAAQGAGKPMPGWLKKVPLPTLAGLAGLLIFVLVGGLWSLFVHWLIWGGQLPAANAGFHGDAQWTTLLWVFSCTLVLAAITGHFAGFINLSSLQSFYSARLTRAYLGASNGERFQAGREALSAAEPLPSDQLALDDYVDRHPGGAVARLRTLAPLHIINLTVNKTVDPSEQLVQRDRKGQPMAVLPFGFSIDERWQTGFPQPSFMTALRRPMLIGQWIGTSGAAFSTGIGRETSLGMSLLMGAANVRLGTWWYSGLGRYDRKDLAYAIARAVGAVFRTQAYLSYELRARFHGTHRMWQYLSDGGHFENTALYELLRPQRRIYQVFGCDAGADPHYHFEDLANLIRLARIDHKVEITVQMQFDDPLADVFGSPQDFRRTRTGEPASATADDDPGAPIRTPCALLLWATPFGQDRPATQIVLFKPHVAADVEPDIRQYAVEHPEFPQEPTADQFFDEAQWESYRALGFHLASKVFDPGVIDALERLARERMGLDAA